MAARTKRTYNLTPESVRRVRELASEYGVAETQDRVVEIAIDRLYRAMRDEAEAARWAAAAADPEFATELAATREAMPDADQWPR